MGTESIGGSQGNEENEEGARARGIGDRGGRDTEDGTVETLIPSGPTLKRAFSPPASHIAAYTWSQLGGKEVHLVSFHRLPFHHLPLKMKLKLDILV
jgi:hypothetical protein